MAISDTTIKAAKPLPDKAYKLSDEKGLHVLINPNGHQLNQRLTIKIMSFFMPKI